jgi:flagellar protein FliJ
MTGYKFPLQKLLEIRVEKEEDSKRKFMEAQREKVIVEQKLNEMKQKYDKYNVIKKHETLIEQKIKRHYLNALTTGIVQTSSELEEKDIKVEECRVDLKKKQVDRKTVEILKDKKKEAFIMEQDRIEQINNDEFALYGYMRRIERG